MSEPGSTPPLPLAAPAPKTGAEHLHLSEESVGTVLEFWQWAYSDLVSNTTRGVFAEFVVASAIGARPVVRDPWQAFDLTTPSGVTIEVKSSAFVQSWVQRGNSKPGFGIAASRAPHEGTGVYESEQRRQAAVYVFCLLASQERPVDPLDVGGWEFFVVATTRLNDELPGQKNISLTALRRLCPRACGYADLLSNIEEAACGLRT